MDEDGESSFAPRENAANFTRNKSSNSQPRYSAPSSQQHTTAHSFIMDLINDDDDEESGGRVRDGDAPRPFACD